MRGVSKGIEAVLVALIVICGLGLLSIGVRSTDMVFDLPLTEDGYYVMTIARNVARGVGFSVDGTTLTNGFHPLWGVLSSLAFLVGAGSDELSMRLVLVASATTTVVSAVLWARLFSNLFGADNRLYRLCFVLIYLTSFQLLAQHFNGLETGLLLALLGAIGFYWSSSEPSLGRNAILGLLLGLLGVTEVSGVGDVPVEDVGVSDRGAVESGAGVGALDQFLDGDLETFAGAGGGNRGHLDDVVGDVPR